MLQMLQISKALSGTQIIEPANVTNVTGNDGLVTIVSNVTRNTPFFTQE